LQLQRKRGTRRSAQNAPQAKIAGHAQRRAERRIIQCKHVLGLFRGQRPDDRAASIAQRQQRQRPPALEALPGSLLMRPLGIDRLYAWFRSIPEEFGRSVFCGLECCARASRLCAPTRRTHFAALQISPNSPEKIHA
jgi:hypothetical protein